MTYITFYLPSSMYTFIQIKVEFRSIVLMMLRLDVGTFPVQPLELHK